MPTKPRDHILYLHWAAGDLASAIASYEKAETHFGKDKATYTGQAAYHLRQTDHWLTMATNARRAAQSAAHTEPASATPRVEEAREE